MFSRREKCTKLFHASCLPNKTSDTRVNTCHDFIEIAANGKKKKEKRAGDSFLEKIITGDDYLVVSNMNQLPQNNELQNGFFMVCQDRRKAKSKVKRMIIAFLDFYGTLHKEFIPMGTTVHFQYYLDVVDRLCKRIQRVRRQQ